MMNCNELMEKRATLWNEAKVFLDSHTDADGKISAEDATTYDKMEADVVALGKDIERLERQIALDAKLSQPVAKPIVSQPFAGKDQLTGRASEEYAKDVLDFIRTKGRKVSNLMQEQTAADGGYLVPAEWDSRLIQSLEEDNIMRSLGTHITTNSEHKINMVASEPSQQALSISRLFCPFRCPGTYR